MKASDFMVKPVIKAKPEDTVRSVLEKFVRYRISGMPVVNDRNEIIGYISDGDIMRRIGKNRPVVLDVLWYSNVYQDPVDLGEKFKMLVDLNVTEVATTHVVTVDEETEIDEIAALLGRKRIKKVPVVRDGVLAGIISRGDIVRAVTEHYLKQADETGL